MSEKSGNTVTTNEKYGSKVSKAKPRWQLDFNGKSQSHNSDLPSPPGYNIMAASEQEREATEGGDPSLRMKRSWDVAVGPFKQVPMNLFMMYMSGNTISIFPIMMAVMMMVRPIKTIITVKTVFESWDGNMGTNMIGQKIVFILGNLANVFLAMYKCHSMGLIPTHTSDWLAFAEPLARAEFGLGGMGVF